MSRRRLLLSVVNLEKYVENLFSNVYYSLIPDTIDGETIRDKGKTKLVEIQGNGVIENQLFVPRASGTPYGVTVINNGDGSLTFSGQATSNGYPVVNNNEDYPITFLAGHKYLVVGGSSALPIYVASNTLTSSSIVSISTTTPNIQTFFSSGTTYNETKKIIVVDLTLMFGTGNEPTTLTDNRIQALLNRGYIPYNTGEYKASRIGEIETFGTNNQSLGKIQLPAIYEGNGAINTHDTMTIGGAIESSTLTGTNWVFNSSISLSAISNSSFVLNFTSNGNSYNSLSCYDNGEDIVSMSYGSTTVYYQQNDYYPSQIGWQNDAYKTITIVGGTDVTNATLIAWLKANATQIVDVDPNAIMFTRRVWKVDLGSLSWGYTTNGFYSIGINNIAKNSGYCICSKYPYSSTVWESGCIGLNATSILWIADTNYSTTNAFQTAMSGTYLYYELATPQVISIPKTNLGCVDLGSLTWNYVSYSGVMVFVATLSGKNPTSNNMFVSKYQTTSISLSSAPDKTIQKGYYYNETDIVIKDSSYTNATDFKAAMSGVILWYETNLPVTPFTTKCKYEKGGTINTNEFSWVENQLYENPNFTSSNKLFANASRCSLTVQDNQAIFTCFNTNNASVQVGGMKCVWGNPNSKVLVFFKAKCSASGNKIISFNIGGLNPNAVGSTTKDFGTWQQVAFIGNVDSNYDGTENNIYTYFDTLANGDVVYFKEYNVIDLTFAFGSGNEPTSIDDPRIQYIINKGYIPTNTTGTQASVQNDVLCNLNMKLQIGNPVSNLLDANNNILQDSNDNNLTL